MPLVAENSLPTPTENLKRRRRPEYMDVNGCKILLCIAIALDNWSKIFCGSVSKHLAESKEKP
eukprot:2728298-Karenia_brevis.AAC.1